MHICTYTYSLLQLLRWELTFSRPKVNFMHIYSHIFMVYTSFFCVVAWKLYPCIFRHTVCLLRLVCVDLQSVFCLLCFCFSFAAGFCWMLIYILLAFLFHLAAINKWKSKQILVTVWLTIFCIFAVCVSLIYSKLNRNLLNPSGERYRKSNLD